VRCLSYLHCSEHYLNFTSNTTQSAEKLKVKMTARQSDEVSLSGYLYKKTRDGRWQKRWFETSGVYLTYYKSKKMEKLLAALSLPQVGGIRIISADEDPDKIEGTHANQLNLGITIATPSAMINDEKHCAIFHPIKSRCQSLILQPFLHIFINLYHVGLFALELSSRVYTLRAKSNAEAELWVKTLSKLRAQGVMSTLNPTGTCCRSFLLSFFLSFFLTYSFFSLSFLRTHTFSLTLSVSVLCEKTTFHLLRYNLSCVIHKLAITDGVLNFRIIIGFNSRNNSSPLANISVATIFICNVAIIILTVISHIPQMFFILLCCVLSVSVSLLIRTYSICERHRNEHNASRRSRR
jgi:PH domain